MTFNGDPTFYTSWDSAPVWNTTGPKIIYSGININYPTIVDYTIAPQQWTILPPLTIGPFTVTTNGTGAATSIKYPYVEFIEFVKDHLTDKCVIFEEGKEKRVVNREEGLRFAWLFFSELVMVSKLIRDHRDLIYKDEEWKVYFKKAVTSEELLQVLTFQSETIKELIGITV